jgi:predicted AAA+ superfamily ATPase
LYYFKDSNGNEIDLIVDNGKELLAVEIKSAKTLATDFFKGLDYWKKISGYSKGYLIYNGIEEFKYSNGNHVLNWRNGVFI